MIILAFYYSHHSDQEWVRNVVHKFERIDQQLGTRTIVIPSDFGSTKDTGRLEVVYPRFVFEHEEKEIIALDQIVKQLQDRLVM